MQQSTTPSGVLLTTTLIRRSGAKAIAAPRRSVASHPHRALALLFALP